MRALAKVGVVTDLDPFDLPTTAFSFASNARFRNGRITRSPVHRNVRALNTTTPRYVFGSNPTSGLDLMFIGYMDGRVVLVTPTAETDYSITSYVASPVESTWTNTHLADVTYVNREDRVPWSLRTSDANFQALTNWDATWRCKLLRSCGGALVALNVTKGAVTYPTMVKTSAFPTAGTVPGSWDAATPSTNATENILAELDGPITDATNFGNDLYIYGLKETWIMRLVGGTALFDYALVFAGRGAINANCSIEVDGKHFVFGTDDIWMHDGVTPLSICDGRVREFIFNSLDIAKANRCFITHDTQLKELHFNYVSGDAYINFLTTDACNRSVVFNYGNNTWTFDDLPLVYSGVSAHLSTAQTFDSLAGTFDALGGSFSDLDDSFKRTLVYVGSTSATYGLTSSLYAFDSVGPGSRVTFSVDPNANPSMYLERDGIDLDELGVDLPGYKLLSSIYPQARLDPTGAALQVTAGVSDYYSSSPVFGDVQTYDNNGNYKLDYNLAGRYLSLRMTYPDTKYISISGYDADLDVVAEK